LEDSSFIFALNGLLSSVFGDMKGDLGLDSLVDMATHGTGALVWTPPAIPIPAVVSQVANLTLMVDQLSVRALDSFSLVHVWVTDALDLGARLNLDAMELQARFNYTFTLGPPLTARPLQATAQLAVLWPRSSSAADVRLSVDKHCINKVRARPCIANSVHCAPSVGVRASRAWQGANSRNRVADPGCLLRCLCSCHRWRCITPVASKRALAPSRWTGSRCS
jgi:hypothetical protein